MDENMEIKFKLNINTTYAPANKPHIFMSLVQVTCLPTIVIIQPYPFIIMSFFDIWRDILKTFAIMKC